MKKKTKLNFTVTRGECQTAYYFDRHVIAKDKFSTIFSDVVGFPANPVAPVGMAGG